MPVNLTRIGKIAQLTAAQEVELTQRIEASLFASQRLTTMTDSQNAADWTLCRDLRTITRGGGNANNHLAQANLRLMVGLGRCVAEVVTWIQRAPTVAAR